MTTFDHRAGGTPESAWADRGEIDVLDVLPSPDRLYRLLVIAAHPDDETLGAGGLIAVAHARGATITVVIATDGEGSHPRSATHTREQLAAVRRGEVQAAIAELSPDATVHFLGLPDGKLAAHSAALTAQLEYFARACTHVVSPWSGDRHPDHEACAQAAANVAAQYDLTHWQYPIWLWHWADPAGDEVPWAQMRRLQLSDGELLAKSRALRCHVSQHTPLSDAPGDEVILSASMLEHFVRSDEVFIVAELNDASSPRYFEALYSHSDDPWDLQGRFYEQRKRALQLAALPRARFRRAFEPGCATGLLTEQLAPRCDEVVAWDVAARALEQTRHRVHAAPTMVRVERGHIPDDWPDGEFDLIVLAEVGYYCVDLDQLVKRIHATLTDDGVVVACHWRHAAPDHPHQAEVVHDAIGRDLRAIVTHVEQDFLMHVWTRTGLSVAATEGIVS
jgi:LmbE family N-acetylglucosaminyl deacetylase/SAM-dependent methyltransferase